MSYRIRYTKEAKRSLPRLPGRYRQRARRLIEALARNPRPVGAVELRGWAGVFRLWMNGWRIIYRVDESAGDLLILGIRFKTGPETYEDLDLD